MVSAHHSEGRHSEGPPFSATSSSDDLWLRIRLGLGLGSVVWLWQYQELFPAATTNDGFQNGGPVGMAALQNGISESTEMAGVNRPTVRSYIFHSYSLAFHIFLPRHMTQSEMSISEQWQYRAVCG